MSHKLRFNVLKVDDFLIVKLCAWNVFLSGYKIEFCPQVS